MRVWDYLIHNNANYMQYLIQTIWHNAAGKSTITREIIENFPKLNYVSRDNIRDYLIENLKYFHWTKYSHNNEKIALVNNIMYPFCEDIVKTLLKNNQDLILDWWWFYPKARSQRRSNIKKWNKETKYIIIYCDVDEKVLLLRLQEREKVDPHTERVNQYKYKRSAEQSLPTTEECDHLIIYDQKNIKEVIQELKTILH